MTAITLIITNLLIFLTKHLVEYISYCGKVYVNNYRNRIKEFLSIDFDTTH